MCLFRRCVINILYNSIHKEYEMFVQWRDFSSLGLMVVDACPLSEGPGSFLFLPPAAHSSAKQSRPARLLHAQKHNLNTRPKLQSWLHKVNKNNWKMTFTTFIHLWCYQKWHLLFFCSDLVTSHFPKNHKDKVITFRYKLFSDITFKRYSTSCKHTVNFRLLSCITDMNITFLLQKHKHTPQQMHPQTGHTLILWKLILQFAPALVGMNLSPSLLGEDNGEPVGVRPRVLCVSFCKTKLLYNIYEYICLLIYGRLVTPLDITKQTREEKDSQQGSSCHFECWFDGGADVHNLDPS